MTATRTANWDALAASAPLNKDAALARDGRGVSFDVPEKARTNALIAPPPMKPYTDIPENDLTNQRFQKLVCLGVRDLPRNTNTGASWVCRCDCGRYACFTSRGLRRQRAEGRAMCSECDYFEEIKAGRHPTKERQEAAQAAKAEQKARNASVGALVHPKLSELRAAFESLDVTPAEFEAAVSDWCRLDRNARREQTPSPTARPA